MDYNNFKIWFKDNYYEVEEETMEIDKDILFKGNKIYSPNTCIFVPHRINSLFTNRKNDRGLYPLGVSYESYTGKFVANCGIKGKTKKIGRFNTPEEAFYAYKEFKEQYIKQVADEYKDKIPKKLYDAMYKYKVEITD